MRGAVWLGCDSASLQTPAVSYCWGMQGAMTDHLGEKSGAGSQFDSAQTAPPWLRIQEKEMSKQEWEIVEDGWGGYYVRENAARRKGSFLVERLIADGIQSAEKAKLIAAAPELLDELKSLYRAYVRLLEAGHDRILSLGGDCDPVDKMESEDQNLRSAQAAIAKATA